MCQEQSFIKLGKLLLTQQLTKLSDFIRESGGFLPLVFSLLLLTVVDVAALTCSTFVFQHVCQKFNILKLLLIICG